MAERGPRPGRRSTSGATVVVRGAEQPQAHQAVGRLRDEGEVGFLSTILFFREHLVP